MTLEELQEEANRLTQLHMDAFLVEFLGADASGLSTERIGELVDAGLVTEETMRGLDVGLGLDPYEFLSIAGNLMDEVSDDERQQMREWGIERWSPVIDVKKQALNQPLSLLEEASQTSKPTLDPPERPQTALEGQFFKEPPQWMSTAEKGAYIASLNRAGQYARGLGNTLAEELEDVLAERWRGTEIVEEVDPLKRERMIDIIREETARTTATTRDARQLAGVLADRSAYYAHNWQRIAVTELQGAHNEGRIIHAIETDGEGAQVARIPESDACEECLRVFTDQGGEIRVFNVIDLQNNGVNVGRTRSEWQATVFPVHPNCRCDTITVPHGFTVLRDGSLRKDRQ